MSQGIGGSFQLLSWLVVLAGLASCGFITAYPMNWWLVKAGIKTAM